MYDNSEHSFIASLDPLALWGDEARQWLQQLRRNENWGIAKDTFQAMVCFRKHDLAAAGELLSSSAAKLVALAGQSEAHPAMYHLLNRWHLSATAYRHYLSGDLQEAGRCLRAAHDEIRSALSLAPFLIPLATHCIDFRIQSARIARRLNRWHEAKAQIDAMRRIYSDSEPFCVLTDGRAIYLSDIREFYESLPLDDEQRQKLLFVLNREFPHGAWLDRLEEQVFALPDIVIPYP